MRSAGALRVPGVLALDREREDGTPAILALEYIAPSLPSDPVVFMRRFGEGLAALHRSSASQRGEYGLDRDGFIGSLP